MNDLKRSIRKLTAVTLSAAIMAGSAVPLVSYAAEPEKGTLTNCILAAKGEIVFTENRAEINGNIFADKISVNQNAFHGKTENRKIQINGFYNTKKADTEYIEATETSDNRQYNIEEMKNNIDGISYGKTYEKTETEEDCDINISDNLYIKDNVFLDGVSFNGSGYITAEKNLKMNINDDGKFRNYCCYYSENGDIIISGTEVMLNGIVYAPSGNVYFDVKHLTVNGSVYADNIYFSGTELTVNQSERAETFAMDPLTVNAGQDITVYKGESALLHGISNYDQANFSWSCNSEKAEIRNAGSADATAVFSEEGRYTLHLTGEYLGMSAEDDVVVTVSPSLSKIYTTDENFAEGKFNGTIAENNSLRLAANDSPASPIIKKYNIGGSMDVSISERVSKNKLSAPSDSVDITYSINLPDQTSDTPRDSGITGTDFVLLLDTSNSTSPVFEQIKEAAKKIVDNLKPGDRIAITKVYKNCVPMEFTDCSEKEQIKNWIDNQKPETKFAGNVSTATTNIKQLYDNLYTVDSTNIVYPGSRNKIAMYCGDAQTDGNETESSLIEYEKVITNNIDYLRKNGVKINMFIYSPKKECINFIQDIISGAKTNNNGIGPKGIFTYCPDGETLKNSMIDVSNKLTYNKAESTSLQTTVLNPELLALDSISPKPDIMTKNTDGTMKIIWNFMTENSGNNINIFIPVSYTAFKNSGIEPILTNTEAKYTDQKGKTYSKLLDNIELPKNVSNSAGTWKSFYDSKTIDYQWTGITWNASYYGNSDIKVYACAGNDPDNLSERTMVSNGSIPEGLKGRYICIETELTASDDGRSPIIDDIIITGGKTKASQIADGSVSAGITGNSITYTGENTVFYADVSSINEKITSYTWSISPEKSNVIDSASLSKMHAVFNSSGKYTVKLIIETETGKKSETQFITEVKDVQAPTSTKHNYDVVIDRHGEDFKLHLERDGKSTGLSDIAWVSVRYKFAPGNATFQFRLNFKGGTIDFNDGDYLFFTQKTTENDFEVDCKRSSRENSLKYVNSDGDLEVIAYDWNGEKIPWYTVDKNGTSEPVYYKNHVRYYKNSSAYYKDNTQDLTSFGISINDIKTSRIKYYIFENTVFSLNAPEKALRNSEAYAYLLNAVSSKQYDVKDNGNSVAVSDNRIQLDTSTVGTHQLIVTSSDPSGAQRTASVEVVEKDNTAPMSSVVFENAQHSYGKNRYDSSNDHIAEIAVSGSDDIAVQSREIYIDGVKIQSGETIESYPHRFKDHYSLDLSSVSAGTHTVKSVVYDTSGNRSETEETFLIGEYDLIRPSISISYSGLIEENVKKYITPAKPDITVTVSDNKEVKSVTALINDKEYPIENNKIVFDSELTEGYYELIIKAADSSSNTSVLSDHFAVISKPDKIPPIITKAEISSYYISPGEKVRITAQAEDDNKLDSIEVTTVDGTRLPFDGEYYEYTPSAVGIYTFTVIAKDAAGNTKSAVLSCSVEQQPTEEQKTEYRSMENETELSDDIKKKADELQTAAAVYEYVKNNIKQEFYSYSRKGANATFHQRGGNDIDTASLLIAMLRYLGYPARYVNGRVSYTNEEIMAMTGISDLHSAVDTLSYKNKDYIRYANGINIERTWAEVYVPASECGIDSKNSIWVTLDGAYKNTKVIKTDNDSSDSMYLKVIVDNEFASLPENSDFRIVSVSSKNAAVTYDQSDVMTFEIDNNKIASVKTSDLAEKTVLLQYLPAEATDYDQYYDYLGMINEMDVTNYRVVPTLTVDGKTIGKGKKVKLSEQFLFGASLKNQILSVTAKSYEGKKVSSQVCPAGIYAIGIDLYRISADELASVYFDSLDRIMTSDNFAKPGQKELNGPLTANHVGAVLAYMSKYYFSEVDSAQAITAVKNNINLEHDIAVGVFGYTENGISRSLKREGILSKYTTKISGKGTLFTDIISGSALLCFNENNFKSKAEKQRRAFDLNFELSMISSYYEGQIWEPYYQKSDTAVSTVSVIQKAAEEGTKLLFIGSGENTASEIDFSGINSDIASMVRKDIDTFTAKNYIIMIPQKPVKIGNWTGFGYSIFDPSDPNKTIYQRINGNRNGGSCGEEANAYDTPTDIAEKALDYLENFEEIIKQEDIVKGIGDFYDYYTENGGENLISTYAKFKLEKSFDTLKDTLAKRIMSQYEPLEAIYAAANEDSEYFEEEAEKLLERSWLEIENAYTEQAKNAPYTDFAMCMGFYTLDMCTACVKAYSKTMFMFDKLDNMNLNQAVKFLSLTDEEGMKNQLDEISKDFEEEIGEASDKMSTGINAFADRYINR